MYPKHNESKEKGQSLESTPQRYSSSYRLPSHHALSFSRLCGIVSLISVSRSSKLALRARLRLLTLSLSFLPSTLAELLRIGRSSTGNVCRGESGSLPLLLRGLSAPSGPLGGPLGLIGAPGLAGLALLLDIFPLLVAGGRL
jgi:hypothetical protein